ncbi:MAG: hypothetical protein HN509_07695 [Halobacteriovoraceae bacterium]|nr:hypothetical protein [Halobacteriovoraceae bacterium]MBT5094409.1 hypothetical protein [Halobacteriovoraceae bacterium]
MNKVNKILILFFVVLGVLFTAGWQFIQTEKFAGFVNKKIAKIIKKKFQVSLSFKRLKVGIFPPATILEKVSLVDRSDDPKFSLSVHSLGAYFSIFDFFSSKLTIEKISFSDGEINLASKITSEKGKKLNTKELFKIYENEIILNAPVRIRNVELNKIDLTTNEGLVEIESLASTFRRRDFRLVGEIGEINWPMVNEPKEQLGYNGLQFDLDVNREKVNIRKLKLYSTINSLSYAGTVHDYLDSPLFNGNINFVGDLAYLCEQIGTRAPKIMGYQASGYISTKIHVEGKRDSLKFNFDLTGFGLKSKVANIDFIKLSGKKEKERLLISTLSAKQNQGTVELLGEVPLFNMKTGTFLNGAAKIKLNELHSNDALYILKDTLEILKARMTGEVDIDWSPKGIFFKPQKGFKVKGLRLENPSPGKVPLLVNPSIKINDGYFHLTENLTLKLDLDLAFKNSNLKGYGLINSEQVDIKILDSTVDLVSFGAIAGVKIEGRGAIEADIIGPLDDVKIDIKGKIANFSVVDLYLGTIDTNLVFSFKKLGIDVKSLSAVYGSTQYTGNGELRFSEKPGLDLSLNIAKSNYSDSKEMYKLVVDQIPYLPNFLNFGYSANYRVTGGFSADDIIVSGRMRGKNLRIVGEDIEKFLVDFEFRDKKFLSKRFLFNKGSGFFKGKFAADTVKGSFSYDAELAGIKLKEITLYRLLNLGYNGDLYGEMYGNGTKDDFSSRSHFRVRNGNIGISNVNDSVLTVYNNGTDLFASGNFLGKVIELDSFFNLNKKDNSKNSYFKAKAHTNNARLISSVFSEHNASDERIKGGFDAVFESTFNPYNPYDINLFFKLNDFYFERGDLEYSLDSGKNKIEIVNGLVKRWDIFIGDNVNQFSSKGSGSLLKKIKIEQDFRVDSSILEIVSDKITKSFGRISGRNIIIGEKGNFSNFLEVFGDDLFISTNLIPQSFSDLSFKVILEGKDLLLQELKAKYGKGTLVADGNVSLVLPFPKININAKAENVFFPLLKKSNLVFSGEVNLKGEKLPYILGGNINILHGEILDEVSEFTAGSSAATDFDRFIPVEKLEDKLDFVQYKLGLDILTPIPIKNGLADIRIDGTTQVRGILLNPRLVGEFKIVPALSKFVFKGHEFILSEGKIIFDGDGPKINPIVGFTGIAKVKDWDIKLAVNGRADKVSIDFASDPPTLSQNDILSLLTIGITQDISKDIGEGDRQNVAAVGLGSLILGQWGIKQGLESSIGFDINISPEFSESESSLLEGRTGDSSGGAKKLKSGTKIKLKKKLRKNVDISVSSVLGESIDQKQEMELIYNINKKMSVDLIYEVKSTDDETAESPESFGVDVKFRIPFR